MVTYLELGGGGAVKRGMGWGLKLIKIISYLCFSNIIQLYNRNSQFINNKEITFDICNEEN